MSYAEKYRRPEWQKKRLQMLERANWKCESCSDEKVQLHVHHKQYIPSRNPWEYKDDQLVVLCENCHLAIHHARDDLLEIIASLDLDGPNSRGYAEYLLAGFYGFELKPRMTSSVLLVEIGRQAREEFNRRLKTDLGEDYEPFSS